MANLLKFKMFICKFLTCWIFLNKKRKLVREFLYWFSFKDYKRFKNTNYYVVSLGNSCLSRALLTAAGIKPRRFYGEVSCPFDLYFSTDIKRTIELIKNDFSDFFKNVDIDAFPHDGYLTLNNFKVRYKKRIKNFLDIQKSNKIVYYVYSNYNEIPSIEDITNLYKVIKSKRGAKPFKFILLTSHKIDMQEIIQIPYEIDMNNSKAIEYIINRYKDYDNEYTAYYSYMKKEIEKIFSN